MRIFRPIVAVIIALGVVLGGCENLGKPAQRFSQYDLGAIEPPKPALAARPELIEVRAPSWLSTSAMQYRLDYRQPARREAYLESRWVSPPAEMIAHALERSLAAAGTRESQCRLRVEIDEFIQVFPERQTSHAELAARVLLLPARGSEPIAREMLALREPAPTPDAEGGVVAQRRAVAALADRIASWLASLDLTESGGLNSKGRCG